MQWLHAKGGAKAGACRYKLHGIVHMHISVYHAITFVY